MVFFSRKEEKIIDKIIYIFIIFLGATLHYSVLFFLILLLTNEKTNETYLCRDNVVVNSIDSNMYSSYF